MRTSSAFHLLSTSGASALSMRCICIADQRAEDLR
jgi:hypothetical protein